MEDYAVEPMQRSRNKYTKVVDTDLFLNPES